MTAAQFGRVVEQYQRLVYTVCYQLVQNHHIAEDLAQETFLSAYCHIDSCCGDSIRPWLARIAANKAKDYLKSAYNRRVSAVENEGINESAVLNILPPPTPEEAALHQAGVGEIREQIFSLKEPYRTVAELYFLQEKSVDEIATALQRPPKTVHTQLHRARKQLQQSILERSVRV